MSTVYRPKYPPAGMTFKAARAAGLLRESAVWWLQYRDATRRLIRESSGTEVPLEAKRILKLREGAVAEGKLVSTDANKVTVRDILADLVTDYEVNARRSKDRVELSISHIAPALGDRKASTLGPADIRAYVARRQGERAATAPSTGNWRR